MGGGEVVKGLTIGQLAKQAQVNIETIRCYERRGLVPEPPQRESGYRQYSPDTVARIKFIKRVQELGFSLREIARTAFFARRSRDNSGGYQGASPYGCLDMARNVFEWTNSECPDGKAVMKGGGLLGRSARDLPSRCPARSAQKCPTHPVRLSVHLRGTRCGRLMMGGK